jgi:hypothetical protein
MNPWLPLMVWLAAMALLAPLLGSVERRRVDTATLPAWERAVCFGDAFVHRRFAYDSDALAVVAAVPYAAHFVLAPVVAFLVLRHAAALRAYYVRTLGTLNCMALAVQLLWPTAPPWYYHRVSTTTGEAAAVLHRVDTLLGVPLFDAVYRSAPVVYGAFPSLHAAWPMHAAAVLWSHWPRGRRRTAMRALSCAYCAWVCFAAVYLQHHFVVDLLGAGALVPVALSTMPRAVKSRF